MTRSAHDAEVPRARRLTTLLAVPALLAATLVPGAWATPANALADRAAAAAPAESGTPVTPESAQEFLDTRVAELLDEHGAPGVAATVVAEGEQVASAAHGYADLADGTLLDESEHAVPSASIGKSITAMAVLQLAEDGDVDLHEDVNTYLPADMRVPGEAVTLHHLLTHTAGFEEVADYDAPEDPDSWRTLAEYLSGTTPERIFPSGRVAAYSNYGYALAGMVVQEVSGLPFEDYTEKHVFGPLGMHATEFGAVPEIEARDEVVTLHRADGNEVNNHHYPFVPAGSAVTSSGDMARFMLALLNRGELGGQRVLSPESVEMMLDRQVEHHPETTAVGYGTHDWRAGPPRGVGHSGGGEGLQTGYLLLPELDAGVFVAVNGTDANPEAGGSFVHDLRMSVLHGFADEFGPAEPAPPGRADPDTDLARYVGTYINTKRSTSGLEQFTRIGTHVRVREDGDGALRISGVLVPNERWIPAGDGLFVAEDGDASLVFVAEDDTVVLYLDDNPTMGFDRAGPLSDPLLHLGIAAAGLLVLLTGLVPLRRPRGPGPASARVIASLTGLSCLVWVGLVVYALLDLNRLHEWMIFSESPALLLPLTTAVPLTALTLAAAVTAWVRGWWGPVGRIHYSLLPLAAIAVIAVGGTYGFVWSPG